MAAAHRREFDAIVVWKINRFGRSLKHLVTALADFPAYGVAFVSLRDNLDPSTLSGRLMFHVVAAMAEFERELIRERVRAGIAKRPGQRRLHRASARECRRFRGGCAALRGPFWSEVCRATGLSKGTAQRAAMSASDKVLVQ
jgi:DNA invertase Pin-like site-specific DNA recombinase